MFGYNYGNRFPQRQQGTIDTKVLLHHDLIEVFRENGRNNSVINQVFQDGSNPAVHNAMPGDTFLLQRKNMIRNGDSSGYMQLGIVALNGMNWQDQYASQMEMESDWAWGGINQTEQLVETSEYGRTHPTNQGSTSFNVGKMTIAWKSTKPIYAGDMACCVLPRAGFHPEADQATYNYPYIPGTVPRAITAVYEPYVPTDVSVQVAGGTAALKLSGAANGIFDKSYTDLYPTAGQNKLSAEQNVAAALKFGIWGIVLAGIARLQQNPRVDLTSNIDTIAARIGLFDTNSTRDPNNDVHRLIHDLTLNMADPTDPMRDAAIANFGGQAELFNVLTNPPTDINLMKHLQAHALQFMFGGISAAQEHKRSRIVGMACSNAMPGEDVTILFGYHCK